MIKKYILLALLATNSAYASTANLVCWGGHGNMTLTVYDDGGTRGQPITQHLHYRIQLAHGGKPYKAKIYMDIDRPGSDNEKRNHQEWQIWVDEYKPYIIENSFTLDPRTYSQSGIYETKFGIKIVPIGNMPSPECYVTAYGNVNIN